MFNRRHRLVTQIRKCVSNYIVTDDGVTQP